MNKRMNRLHFVYVLLSLLGFMSNAYAVEIDHSCLASFPVGNKGVSFETEGVGLSMSCKDLESLRLDTYEILEKWKNYPESEAYATVLADIKFIEDKLAEAITERNFALLDVVDNLQGNLAAGLGMSVCLGAASPAAMVAIPGCAYASFKFVNSKVKVLRSTMTMTEKVNAAQAVKSKLIAARKSLDDNNDKMSSAIDNAIKDFNNLCNIVRDKCL